MTSNPARVVVIGTSCAGKTRFARSLACALHCPHVELGALYWQPNWVPRTSDEFRALTAPRVMTQEQLFSGNRESLRMAFFSRESILW